MSEAAVSCNLSSHLGHLNSQSFVQTWQLQKDVLQCCIAYSNTEFLAVVTRASFSVQITDLLFFSVGSLAIKLARQNNGKYNTSMRGLW